MAPDELRALRDKAGLSRLELATELGITSFFIAMLEDGHRPIDRRTELAARYVTSGAGLSRQPEALALCA